MDTATETTSTSSNAQPQLKLPIGMACRIPLSLQAIFLASNQGAAVNDAPVDRVDSKEFVRSSSIAVSLSSLSGSSNNSSSNNKNSSFTVTKKRTSTKLALLKPAESNKSMTATASQKLPHQSLSPQDFLDGMLRSRGYSCEKYESLKSAYFNKPTPLQIASYQTNLIQMLASRDVSTTENLRQVLASGISSNPCNAFSESLVHIVCRRGRTDLLELFVEAGCSLQCADDYGRTPLHDACWTAEPSFPTVELLLQQDVRLLYIQDARGSLPLSYVHKDHWPAWIDYLKSIKERFWKSRSATLHGEQEPPELMLQAPNSRPLPDPNNALSPDLACLVAAGKIDPSAVMLSDSDSESDMTNSDGAYSANYNNGGGGDSSSCDSSGGDSEEDYGDEQVQDTVAFSIDAINVVKDYDGKYSTGSCNESELLSTSTANDSTDDDFDMDSDDDDDDDDNISAAMAAAMLATQVQANLFR